MLFAGAAPRMPGDCRRRLPRSIQARRYRCLYRRRLSLILSIGRRRNRPPRMRCLKHFIIPRAGWPVAPRHACKHGRPLISYYAFRHMAARGWPPPYYTAYRQHEGFGSHDTGRPMHFWPKGGPRFLTRRCRLSLHLFYILQEARTMLVAQHFVQDASFGFRASFYFFTYLNSKHFLEFHDARICYQLLRLIC